MIYRSQILLGLTVFAIASVLMVGCENNGTAKKIESKTAVKKQKPKRVKLDTTMGDIVIELDEKAAPVTVENFLRYTKEGFFDGTIFHRVIKGFVIQGGGLTSEMKQKKPREPIVNEADNGLKNSRGTVAMARTQNPDSATCQFFINHKDNPNLNYKGQNNPGYAVFGKVVEGMDVVDKIASVKTTRKGRHRDVPVETVLIKSAKVVSGK
jgi:peptidyl-prolyl cis-trans isomerase B (cyclophilin B)